MLGKHRYRFNKYCLYADPAAPQETLKMMTGQLLEFPKT
jgi:hypothetical protein